MKNIYKTIFLLLISVNIIYAQDEGTENIATNILNQLSEKWNTYSNITSEFSYHFYNETNNINDKSSGNISIQKDKYNLKMSSGLYIINNGKTMWYI